MKYKDYIRIKMSDYQVYQEIHSDEWSEVAFIGGEDVLIPKKWYDEYQRELEKDIMSKLTPIFR